MDCGTAVLVHRNQAPFPLSGDDFSPVLSSFLFCAMTLTREKLIKDLTEAGILSADEVTRIESDAGSTGIDALLSELVDQGKITPYQAEKFESGNAGEIAFGDYVVIDELGRGGMGTVLRARHRRMEREVAIKILPVAALDSESAIARFYQEVKVAAQLTHPNIVLAYDAGEHQGFHYLVMEYVRGEDLAKLVNREGAIELGSAIDYVLQTATGLQYAHRKGVVHRDIKPSNLLLDEENSVKILDMGLARIGQSGINEDAKSMHLTTTGQVMGTVEYMAPEQAEDTRNADHRSDIYSLGCTMYRLISGAAPFSRDTVVKTILAHREAPIPSLGKGAGPAYDRLDAIFNKMVAKHPEDRYQNCTDLINDLRSVRDLVRGTREERTVQFSASPTTKSVPPVVGPKSDASVGTDSAEHGRPQSDPDSPTVMRASHPQADSKSGSSTARIAPGSHSDISNSPNADLVEEVFEVRRDRAKPLLIWGIISIVTATCCFGGIPGIIVWVLANSDLKLMDAGKMDDTNRGTVVAAKVCGMIGAGIFALVMLASIINTAIGG